MAKEILQRAALYQRVYDHLYNTDGLTVYALARKTGYSVTHMRTIMNEMVALYPNFIGVTHDTYNNMPRKTYYAKV